MASALESRQWEAIFLLITAIFNILISLVVVCLVLPSFRRISPAPPSPAHKSPDSEPSYSHSYPRSDPESHSQPPPDHDHDTTTTTTTVPPGLSRARSLAKANLSVLLLGATLSLTLGCLNIFRTAAAPRDLADFSPAYSYVSAWFTNGVLCLFFVALNLVLAAFSHRVFPGGNSAVNFLVGFLASGHLVIWIIYCASATAGSLGAGATAPAARRSLIALAVWIMLQTVAIPGALAVLGSKPGSLKPSIVGFLTRLVVPLLFVSISTLVVIFVVTVPRRFSRAGESYTAMFVVDELAFSIVLPFLYVIVAQTVMQTIQ